MAKLLADENFPKKAVDRLSLLGHNITTVRQQSQSKYGDGMPDELVLQWAARDRMIVLTCNGKHFKVLHEAGAPHHGIIACPSDQDEKWLAKAVHEKLRSRLGRQFVVIRRPAEAAPRRHR